MTFQQGQSGNPEGRPKGTKDKRTELRELLQPHAAALMQKAVTMALAGDTTALRICIDRIVAPLKTRDAAIQLSGFRGSLSERGNVVLAAMAEGQITAEEAVVVIQALSTQARVAQVDELERRIAALEAQRSAY